MLLVVAALGEPESEVEQRNAGAQGLAEPEVEVEVEVEAEARRSGAGAAGSSAIWAGRRASGWMVEGRLLGSCYTSIPKT